MRFSLSLRQRLLLGFSLMAVLVLAASGTGMLFTRSVENTVDTTQNGLDYVRRVGELERAWFELAATIDRMLLTRQTSLIDSQLNSQLAAFDDQVSALQTQTLGQSADVIAHNRIIQDTLQELSGQLDRIVADINSASEQSQWARAQVLRHTDLASLQRRFTENLDQLSANIQADVDASVHESIEAQNNMRTFWTVVAGLALITSLFAAFFTQRSIVRPIAALVAAAQTIRSGDLSKRAEVQSQDEIGTLAEAFNSMTDQLSDLIDHLEERVEARTRDLQIAANVSRQITTVLDIDRLLQQVVTLTTKSFGLYAAFIFRFDEASGTLVRSAGVDADGHALAESGEDIALDADPSVVALAARIREAVTVNDVTASPIYRSSGLLPETQAELAIPLVFGNRLLGVFDLQAHQAHRFSEDDLRVLVSLAEQITIAMRNAQLFAEAQLARETAEEASRVKSQFLANMSHELRTPLNAILNFTGFVADGILGEVNEEQVDSLNKVMTSSQHLLSLINDILDLTKIEVGMMDLFIQEVDLNNVLESTLSTAKGLVTDKPLKILTDIQPDLPSIQGDRRRIRQILLNVVSNAVKFTPEGHIKIAARHEDGMIHIAVSDTGVGIPPDQADRVFESFQQTRHDLSETPGTGLGMPITKAFVEAHGGQIWFESEVHKGTTFHITLPVQIPQKQAASATVSLQDH